MIDQQIGGCWPADEELSRSQRRFRVVEGLTGALGDDHAAVGAILDVETTGKSLERDKIIELAIRRFRYNKAGVITAVGKCYSWLEDPGEPLGAEIVELTGLTDDLLAGQRLDERAILNVMRSSSVIIAHNAAFDRRFVERRLPDAAGLPWACSCNEIVWPSRGLKARSLECLLCKQGWDHQGHRAQVDVDGVLLLLQHGSDEGSSALSELLERAQTPGWRVWARGANISLKEELKQRGYRFDWTSRTWFRDISDDERATEERWLEGNVYCPAARPTVFGPEIEIIDWTRRWS